VSAFFPIKGFLGTGATFAADVNLVVQFIMGAALIAGWTLAKQKRYRAHAVCQTTVLLLNLLPIGLVMWPTFHQQVAPRLPRVLHGWYYASAVIHAVLGVAAELLGLYIVTVAGTEFLPRWLRFTKWKRWMRAELALWFVVLFTGAVTYYIWYIAPFR
jgi:uncharacterized membrane protein YozB (DUF420 family)